MLVTTGDKPKRKRSKRIAAQKKAAHAADERKSYARRRLHRMVVSTEIGERDLDLMEVFGFLPPGTTDYATIRVAFARYHKAGKLALLRERKIVVPDTSETVAA